MKLLRILPIVFLFAVGCGKAKAKSAADKALDDAEANATAFCNCKKEDTECMAKAVKAGEESEAAIEKEKLTPEQEKRKASIEEKVGKCAANEPVPVEPTPTGNADQDKLLADMAALQDAACKCADAACLEAALKPGDDFEERMKAIWKDEASMPADVATKIGDMKKAVEACAAKIGGGGGPTPPADDPAAQATAVLDAMDALADEICKCADMACAEPVGKTLDETEKKLHEIYTDKTKVPPELMTRGEGIETKVKDCVAKFASP